MATIQPDQKPSIWRILAATLAAQILLVLAAVAWVAIYSHLIAPDQPMTAYHAHAQVSGPWVSLIVGVPVFLTLSIWLARARPAAAKSSALLFAAVYIAFDLAILLLLATTAIPWAMVILNYVAKTGAAWWGAHHATQRFEPAA